MLRKLPQSSVLLIALLLCGPATADEWDVTFAVRVGDAGGKPVEVRIALPPETPSQRVRDVRVEDRGLKTQIIQGEQPEVVVTGAFRKARRIAVTYTVAVTGADATVPAIEPPQDPPLDLYVELSPAPLFPSRSILVREFLEEHAAPLLVDGDRDVMRAIYNVSRTRLQYKSDGKSLPLDVVRRGQGQRIGIERVFTTFLRCARIPARFIEGIKLDSRTKKKRVFWSEAWADSEWWPISASRGWVGKRPATFVALTHDGRRAVRMEGDGTLSYTVQAQRKRSAKP